MKLLKVGLIVLTGTLTCCGEKQSVGNATVGENFSLLGGGIVLSPSSLHVTEEDGVDVILLRNSKFTPVYSTRQATANLPHDQKKLLVAENRVSQFRRTDGWRDRSITLTAYEYDSDDVLNEKELWSIYHDDGIIIDWAIVKDALSVTTTKSTDGAGRTTYYYDAFTGKQTRRIEQDEDTDAE